MTRVSISHFTGRVWSTGALIAISAGVGGCLGSENSDKAGGGAGTDALVLTLANPGEPDFDVDEFSNEVASRSNGAMRIEIENGWREGEADPESKTIEDVLAGTADLGKVSARTLAAAGVNSMQSLIAPLVVDSYALQREVLHSPAAEQILSGVEELDLEGVALLPGEFWRPLGVSRPLIAASDYRGATIGIRESDLSMRTFRALGATTDAYEPREDISSFDGVEADLASIEFGGYDGPARTLAANVNLWPRALAVVMNRDAYASLTEDERAVLRAAGEAAIDVEIDDLKADDEEALGVICRRDDVAVRSLTPAQLAGLRAATGPVTRALRRDPATASAMSAIAAMRARVAPRPGLSCPADDVDSAAPATDTTAFDGVWHMETTAAELAEVDPVDVMPESWGTQTFVFSRGRFAYTEENREACIWGYGTYTVDGDIVEWTFEDGGGQSPNGATNQPGELFRFGWSRYRDQVTLTPVEGAISPANYRVEPWRRLSGKPSLDELSDRCPPPAEALAP
jgi:TRAP-type C4-dicarboxylate transport system substrate-binding protein